MHHVAVSHQKYMAATAMVTDYMRAYKQWLAMGFHGFKIRQPSIKLHLARRPYFEDSQSNGRKQIPVHASVSQGGQAARAGGVSPLSSSTQRPLGRWAKIILKANFQKTQSLPI